MSRKLTTGADWALSLIRTLPRVSLTNLKGEPHPYNKKSARARGQHGGRKYGGPNKGSYQRMSYPRLGWEGGQTPFYLKQSVENYYKGHHLKRQYPPISLGQLQMLIDTNRINASEPIDLTSICNTKIYSYDVAEKHFGFHLTDEGIDNFKAKVNIEVQWVTEPVIAAVEKNGGIITTAYYDRNSLYAARDPLNFFKRGVPIPKRMIPPEDAIEFYTDPKFRGYLADPDRIAEERLVLAQKYGYTLPDLQRDPAKEMLLRKKDPRQVFFGLEPGWYVSLRDKCILKPKDETLKEYYKT